MRGEKNPQQTQNPQPPRAGRLLDGLRRQREELGAIADELIELFGRHGVAKGTPPGAGEAWPDEAGQSQRKDD